MTSLYPIRILQTVSFNDFAPHIFNPVLSQYHSTSKKRLFLTVLLLATIFAPPAAAQDQPNIIFIFSDDHTAQAVGAYQGHLNYGLELDHTPTPNIDRLARQGIRFDNAFVANSICKPSRAAVLTGRFGHETGVTTNRKKLDPALTTFPKMLQKKGYLTGLFGKWHLGSEPRGFDHYEVLYGQGPYWNPPLRTPDGRVKHTGYTSTVITDRALDWLKQRDDGDQPFMAMVHHKATHGIWLPGPDHYNDYDGQTVPMPDTLFYDYSGLTSPASQSEMHIYDDLNWGWLKLKKHPGTGNILPRYKRYFPRFTKAQQKQFREAYRPENRAFHERFDRGMTEKEVTRWKYQRYIKDYLRTGRTLDDMVGRVMNYLDRTGLDENTIVIYSSDQGRFIGENGWHDKRWMYEESLRIPLIVRWPEKVKAGSVDRHLVQNIDFAPTLLELAGAEVPDRVQGRSLVPLLKGEDPDDWRDAIYYQYREYPGAHSVRKHFGIRTQRYKLIYFHEVGAWELFDLKEDPDELNSVYGDAGYTKIQKRLKRELRRLQEKYDVPGNVALD